jgi:hypothetical protein
MPLDEATTRFAFLMQRDLRKMADREEAHAQRGEEIKYDPVSRMATYETRRGGVASRLFGEPIAAYATDDRIFRWAWAGRAASAEVSHVDVIFHEGQSRDVPQLMQSIVDELEEEEAMTLAKLGVIAAQAEALHVRRNGTHIEFVGLFDRPKPADKSIEPVASRISMPPPEVAARARDTPPPRAAPYRSLPPIREIYAPRTSSKPPAPDGPRKLREPTREHFLPVATAMLAALARSYAGYTQALFVVTVDEHERRRVVVQLVCNDGEGILRSVDAPTELVDAAAQMVDADRRDGNARWRRMSVRATPKPDGGATLHVDVV